jgi:hypothetical protein
MNTTDKKLKPKLIRWFLYYVTCKCSKEIFEWAWRKPLSFRPLNGVPCPLCKRRLEEKDLRYRGVVRARLREDTFK